MAPAIPASQMMGDRTLNKTLASLAAAIVLPLVSAPALAVGDNCDTNYTGGERTTPESRFSVNGDGTVTDSATNLMWMKCAAGKTGTTCTGDADYTDYNLAEPVTDMGVRLLNWNEALAYAAAINNNPEWRENDGINPGNHSDWRLPNAKELASLVERCSYNPAMNQNVFSFNVPLSGNSGKYWTSTPAAQKQADQQPLEQPLSVIVIDFHAGNDWREGKTTDFFGKPNKFYLRLVRNVD